MTGQEKQVQAPVGQSWIKGFLKRLSVAGVVALLALFLFARFSAEFGEQGGRLPQFDRNVLDYFQENRVGWLYQFAHGVSWLFLPTGMLVMGIAAIAYFFLNHRRDAAATVVLAGVGGTAVISALKLAFQRPRPQEIFAPLGYSFPSGHTFMAVTLLGIVGYYLAEDVSRQYRPWIWGASVLTMVLVGWSRMYLGEHFPSDVGAGASAGLCWIWVCLYARSFFWRNTPAQERTAPSKANDGAPGGVAA